MIINSGSGRTLVGIMRRLEFVLCTPVHDALVLVDLNFHQAAAARPPGTRARVWPVQGTMGRTQQPLTRDIEDLVWLPVQLHGDMCATVEISLQAAPVAYRKRTARLAKVHHIEGNGFAAIAQSARITQRHPTPFIVGPWGLCQVRHSLQTTVATQPPSGPLPSGAKLRMRLAHARRN